MAGYFVACYAYYYFYGASRVSVALGHKPTSMAATLISLARGIGMALSVEASSNLMARLMHCLRARTKMAVAAVEVDVDDAAVVAVILCMSIIYDTVY